MVSMTGLLCLEYWCLLRGCRGVEDRDLYWRNAMLEDSAGIVMELKMA